MEPADLLRQIPLVTAAAWLLLVFAQVYRDRFHTWTERFFLFACFFAALYGFSDWMFFNTSLLVAEENWGFAASNSVRLSLSSIALAELFFLLFAITYVRRMYSAFWLLAAVTGALVWLVWSAKIDFVGPEYKGGLFFPLFDEVFFAIYLGYIVVVGSAGIFSLYRIYRAVRGQSQSLARRTGGLFATFTAVLVLGLLTNGILGATRNYDVPPPFSSLLLPLAAATMYTLAGGRERISEAMRRFRARHYTMQSAFLVFNDGTLIGSISREGDTGVDRDLLMATLDVIQNFMRTSFPILKGKSLKTIEHGDVRILIERGRYCYLAIVLTGEENDLLRRQMRDELLDFEERNRGVLAKWRGVQEDAVGTEGMLGRLLEPPRMFELVVAQ